MPIVSFHKNTFLHRIDTHNRYQVGQSVHEIHIVLQVRVHLIGYFVSSGMKRFLQFLCVGLLFAACSEITYKEPQPRGIKSLNQVPAKLQGSYQINEEGETVDTLRVIESGYRLGKDDVASLSDSLILKYYKGYYFLNIRDKNAWYLRVIKLQKNGDMTYLEMPGIPDNEEEKKQFLSKLSADIKIIETEADDKKYYVIDPSPKMLLALIKKGHFKEQTFTRLK